MGEWPLAMRDAAAGARAVAAVRGEVLRDEDDLAERGGTVGGRGERVDLGQDLLGRP